MSDSTITTVLVAFFACLPPTLLALAALMSSRTNTAKADVIVAKVAEVHSLTNSQLTAVTTALAVANEKILGLEKLLLRDSAAPKQVKPK